MLGKYLVKKFGCRMAGKTEMTDLAFGFFLLAPVPAVVFVKGVDIFRCYVVQQIKVQIIGAETLQRFVKNAFDIFRAVHVPRRELGSDGKAVAGMAFNQSLADGNFRAVINISCVEIGKSLREKIIDHHAGFCNIDLAVLSAGKAHHAEAEFGVG